MQLRDEFLQSGTWLFRWRSYLPLVLIGLLVAGTWAGRSPGGGHDWGVFYDGICVVVALLGLVVRAIAIGYAAAGTSGRNVNKQKADNLNTTGVYSVLRHPLYLGNFLLALGLFMFTQAWWAPTIYAFVFWLYYERIMFVEEDFLLGRFGTEFEEWARRTPAFIPSFRRHTPPTLPFSLRKVLRREYSGLLAIVVSFVVLELLGSFVARDRSWRRADPSSAPAGSRP